MKRIWKTVVLAVLVLLLVPGSVFADSAVQTKVVKQLPPSVTVGSTYHLKVKFTNKFYEKTKGKPTRLPVYMTAWLEWGGCSYKSGSDFNPQCYTDKGSEPFCSMYKKPRCKYLKTATPRYRWIKPRKSRTVSLPLNYKQCLPPNVADPTLPGTIDPTNHYYSGLPCASGRWYLKTRGYIRGWGWRQWTINVSDDLFVTPAPQG
jgi:hypothetical protein